MKDAFGNELAVGDTIVYARRQSSSMWLTKTTIVGFKTRPRYWEEEKVIETAICINQNYESVEDQKAKWEADRAKDAAEVERLESLKEPVPSWLSYKPRFWPSYRPKTVTLSAPEYIVKVS